MTTAEPADPLPEPGRVEALAGFGLSAAEIARVFDLDQDLVKTTFARELSGGQSKANARVAEILYRKATGEGREAVTAAIFWLKTRTRWKETSVHELAGAGEPITFRTVYETKPDEA